MQLTTYAEAKEFLEVAQPFLEKEEALASLMFGVTLGLRAHPERIKTPPYLATIVDESGLVMAVMMTPPYNVNIYTNRDATGEALDLLVQDLAQKAIVVPGVMAPSPIAKAFAEIWTNLTGQNYKTRVNMRLFELTRVIEPSPASGFLRKATEADFEIAARWAETFGIEAFSEKPNPVRAQIIARTRIGDGTLYLWEDAGQVVSMAGVGRPTLNTTTVSLVYTPPEMRGKGYASSCVAGISQLMLNQGYKSCVLFTDLANPISNSIYQKMGYCPLADFDELTFS